MFRPKEWLFYGASPDVPIGREAVQRMFQKAKKKAGIEKRGGIHILRHAFATHLLEDRVDIGTLQSLLGHADIRTTMVY
ncbi:MAG: tyrosine-type recombinase/integrase, partial [Proteobacteria bacterium]|nr:tyrosine-type recombinase/integrase [Pseudomonadota bacterium]